MQSGLKPNRRAFLKRSALGAATVAIANPLGLFSPRAALAGIPSGDYMRSLSDSQFWFHRLLAENSDPTIQSADSQLSIRLGLAGGFAVGYFNTMGFLSDYKDQKPLDYRDLLINAARLPKTPDRPAIVARMLEQHRRYSDIHTRADKLAQENKWFTKDSLAIPAFPDKFPPEKSRPQGANRSFSKTLESLSSEELVKSIVEGSRCPINTFDKKTVSESTVWPEASAEVQKTLSGEFLLVNPKLESRFESLDAGRVVQFTMGKLDLSWLNHTLFPTAFQSGIVNGRLAALAYMAMIETGLQLKVTFPTGESKIEHIDSHVVKFAEARLLEETFGADDFWKHGLDVAAFRPAIRLKTVCVVTDKDGKTRRLELITPFLPFDVRRQVDPALKQSQQENEDAVATAVTKYFSDTSLSRYDMPLTTRTIVEGAFDGCGEVARHTIRLIRQTADTFEPLRNVKLQLVSLIPEVTSPWTFAGVGCALFNGYLTGLRDGEKLSSEEERLKFKWSVNRATDDLLQRSVKNDGKIGNSSAPVPAMVQYASGYRTAILLADILSDKIAQGAGARLVYDNLVKAMPEYFKELPKDKFLSAEEIAGYVLHIASGVQTEIEALRLRVRELEKALAQYKEFNEKLAKLIADLSNELSKVNNQDELKQFQAHAADLIKGTQTNLDAAQAATLTGIQGLLNTFVQVGVKIEANIETKLKAEAKVNVQFCSVGGAK